ncbi:MAG: hypothetical protein LBQ66_15625 [Planctomycetaceae bacterium]|nr:hypothetical protein [Planctomycetaceae bacterium]
MVLIFFVFCPLLTLLITAGIFLRKLPTNVYLFEQVISLRTGLTCEIGSVDYRKFNKVRLRKVRFFCRESRKPFFSASEVDVTYITAAKDRSRLFPGAVGLQVSDSYSQSNFSGGIFTSVLNFFSGKSRGFWGGVSGRRDGFWHISVVRSVVDLKQRDQVSGGIGGGVSGGVSGGIGDYDVGLELRDGLSSLLSNMFELSGEPVLVTMDEVTVLATSLERFETRFVVGNLYQTESAVRSEWSFLIPVVSETEREFVSVVRRRNSRNLSVSLKTGSRPLPCEFVSLFCPQFRVFGQLPARFLGEITASTERFGYGADSNWTYSLRNVFFNDIDITQVLPDGSYFGIRGKVKGLQVNEAVLGDGMLSADGWMEVIDGAIERNFFHRLVQQFALTVTPASLLDSPRSEYPFGSCIFNYQLRRDGAIFWPSVSENIDNVLMINLGDGVQTQPMMVAMPKNNRQPVSYHTILSVFAPDNAPIVPLTSLSKFFVPLLPTDEPDQKNKKTTNPNNNETLFQLKQNTTKL